MLNKIKDTRNYNSGSVPLEVFRTAICHKFFKIPLDAEPYGRGIMYYIRHFYFTKAKWFEIYDLIEFILDDASDPDYEIRVDEIIPVINTVLEKEFSAYRLINNKFVPITNDAELIEIDEAILETSSLTALKGCNIHLATAIKLLSDKKSPDYRNSIKESISAIESLTKIISNSPKNTLGGAIDKIKGKITLHPSLEKGFKQIYGYTSDSDGIRHALMEVSNCDFEDAKYMLVACSAFINYLIAKSNKAGIVFT